MRERPIQFSAPMVRAILSGAKTQTRRALRVQPPSNTGQVSTWHHPDPRPHYFAWVPTGDGGAEISEWPPLPCPYGQPGDRLWVRESHWWFKDEHDPVTGYFPPKLTAEDVEYRADGEKPGRVWRPSIHMPRWASRITLEVLSVRVERLQGISESDAMAEGADEAPTPMAMMYSAPEVMRTRYREGYAQLWESIKGAGSWDENPWVWVVEFRPTHQREG